MPNEEESSAIADASDVDHQNENSADDLLSVSIEQKPDLDHAVTGSKCKQLAEQEFDVDCNARSEFTCTKCARAFPTLTKLDDHMYLHSTSCPYKCMHCEEQFSLPDSLSIHMKQHTESSKSSVRVPNHRNFKSYVCGECGKTLTSQSGYKTHLFLHTGQRPHQCFVCGDRFTLVSHLKSHIFVRHSNRDGLSHKCAVCEKKYLNPVSLKRHMQYHKSKDSFACPVCSKQMTSSWGLKEHIQRTHVVGVKKKKKSHRWNPKSYTCAECGKSLMSRQGYAAHLFLHTGRRPHICTVCDKTFALSSHLRSHMAVHRSDREIFPCSECGKRLISQRALERHMTLHTGTQKHCCTECDRRSEL